TDQPAVAVLEPAAREHLRTEVGRLLVLWTSVLLRQAAIAEGSGVRSQGSEVGAQALRLIDAATRSYPPNRRPAVLDRQRAAALLLLRGSGNLPSLTPQPLDPSTPSQARDLALLAGESLTAGRFTEALPLLEEASRRQPDDCWVWFDLGLCHEALGRDA